VLCQRRSKPDRLEAEGNVRGKGALTREIYSEDTDLILPLVSRPFPPFVALSSRAPDPFP
jgi:hypothetical protein